MISSKKMRIWCIQLSVGLRGWKVYSIVSPVKDRRGSNSMSRRSLSLPKDLPITISDRDSMWLKMSGLNFNQDEIQLIWGICNHSAITVLVEILLMHWSPPSTKTLDWGSKHSVFWLLVTYLSTCEEDSENMDSSLRSLSSCFSLSISWVYILTIYSILFSFCWLNSLRASLLSFNYLMMLACYSIYWK